MYYDAKLHNLIKREVIRVGREEKKYEYEAFVLGDYILSFALTLPDGGIKGELCLFGGGTPAYIFDVENKAVFTRKEKIKLAELGDVPCAFSIVYTVSKRRFDIYVNGSLVLEGYNADAGIPVNCDKLVKLHFAFSSEPDRTVVIEDLMAHSTARRVEGAVVYDPSNTYFLGEKEVVLTDKNYIPSDAPERERLSGCSAIHLRSGVLYRDGEKRIASVLPIESDGEHFVDAPSLSFLLGVSEAEFVARSGGRASLSRSGTAFFSLEGIAAAFGKELYIDKSAVHFGMAILHDGDLNTEFDKNSLQNLNDFLFYFRPTKEKILEDYNASALKGKHPRVLAREEDFERLRAEVKANETKAKWFKKLIAYADSLEEKETLRYELRDGVRLIYVAWDLQHYAMSLALAYKLTGDEKYYRIARPHLLAAAEMPDWNPSHHIDVGILAFGYAIAYDWFYDIMSEDDRAMMERGAYRNLFYTLNRAFEDPHTAYTTVMMKNNHNVFTNAGVMATVIAFMDLYPDIASQIGSNVIRILECFMDKFAPEGAYYEGPYYAETAIGYTVRLFAAIEPALGTLYGLDRAQGFDGSAAYMMHLQSDVAAYNFADSQYRLLSTSGLFWQFSHYGISGFKDSLASLNFRDPPIDSIPEALLWYDVSPEEKSAAAAREIRYPEEEIITMRSSYGQGQTFVGIKAGNTVYAHSHLDAGSFVLDALGRRWAYDFGQDNYNLYYKYSHWDVFRLRAESHNTLVVNPDRSPGYVLGSRADVTEFTVSKSEDSDVKTAINMTELYGKERGVDRARRGYLFTDCRSSLVIRDEVKLSRKSDMIWLLYTDAKIGINGKIATLSDPYDENKSISIEFCSPSELILSAEPAIPLPTSPTVPGQAENKGFWRLSCRFSSVGETSVTVKINIGNSTLKSPITKYDCNMDLWELK